ncbi:hypothetical protein V8E55_010341, partial [Tylopilus felleus]
GVGFLNKVLLTLVGKPLTTEHLATVFLHITQMSKTSKLTIEAIHLVAFLFEEENLVHSTNLVTEDITSSLPRKVATKVVAAISPQMAIFMQSNKSLKANINSLQMIQLLVANILAKNTLKSSAEKVIATVKHVNACLTDVKEAV